jgi:hypothetical protein
VKTEESKFAGFEVSLFGVAEDVVVAGKKCKVVMARRRGQHAIGGVAVNGAG